MNSLHNIRRLPSFELKYLLLSFTHPILNIKIEIMLLVLLICFLLLYYAINRKTSGKLYLIDFACYKPPNSLKCSKEQLVKYVRDNGNISEDMMDFIRRYVGRTGIGDSTYLAEIFFEQSYKPSMKYARKEVEMSIFGSVDMLMAKTGVRCEDIRILVVTCCVYNTMPSLSSMILNRYEFRDNTITYNLTGMGCSAGLLAIRLAKELLQVHHNSYALIVSTESTTENLYLGEDQSKHLSNFIFRLGGAAILLSNRPSDHSNSKYELLHAIQTNTSSSDQSYNSIVREEDNNGMDGININKNLIAAAIATIKPNVTTVGRHILPIKEKTIYLITYITRKLFPALKIQPYIPNYSTAINHFLPHVGGKPVLDDLQKTLRFSDECMEASRMTLYRYGNTSTSSIWYELAYVEAKGRARKGNRIWQIAFGSGFKCSSIIWRAMKTVNQDDDNNPWTDEIAGFPVSLNDDKQFPVYFNPSK